MTAQIRTQRLVLRPFRSSDLTPLHAIFSDPRAMRYWDRPAWNDLDNSQKMLAQFMANAPDQQLEYAVDLNGHLIGRVGMWKPYEVGYIFSPDVWGHGYATEAMRPLIAEIFARFENANPLTAEIDPRNTASAGVLRNCGFSRTALVEKNFHYGGTEWCDTAYFELPRPV